MCVCVCDCGIMLIDHLSVSPSTQLLLMKATRGNMLGAGTSNNKVKYSRLAADDDGYIDLQVRGVSLALR